MDSSPLERNWENWSRIVNGAQGFTRNKKFLNLSAQIPFLSLDIDIRSFYYLWLELYPLVMNLNSNAIELIIDDNKEIINSFLHKSNNEGMYIEVLKIDVNKLPDISEKMENVDQIFNILRVWVKKTHNVDIGNIRIIPYNLLNDFGSIFKKYSELKPGYGFLEMIGEYIDVIVLNHNQNLLKCYPSSPLFDFFSKLDENFVDFSYFDIMNAIMEYLPNIKLTITFKMKDKSNWELKTAREKIRKDEKWEDSITDILYRPFDMQWVFYHDAVIERSRKEVMKHMMQENLSLCVGRAGQVVGIDKPWNIVFCSHCMEDFNLFYRGGNVNFPLYLYPKKDNSQKRSSGSTLMLFEPPAEYVPKTPNLSANIVNHLIKSFGKKTPTPEEIFFYVYAVLYSNIFRTKYADFLRSDFPRVPFTKKPGLFSNMATYGKRLAQLHLLQSSELNPPIAKFRGKGEGIVEIRILFYFSNFIMIFDAPSTCGGVIYFRFRTE